MASIGYPASFPASIPGSFPAASPNAQPIQPGTAEQAGFGGRHLRPAEGHCLVPVATKVTRRPTPQQGRALLTLSRALEYLVDSYVVNDSQEPMQLSGPELEAVQILMRANRAVFAECAVVVPLRRRLRQWLFGRRAAA